MRWWSNILCEVIMRWVTKFSHDTHSIIIMLRKMAIRF